MPTRPNSPHSPDSSDPSNPAFAGLGPGLAFFQDWIKAAGSAMPNLAGAGTGQTGAMPAWSLPTLDPQELDKRIQDLRTVQFWLEQNARMIAMTIQALEVQKMTLGTLQGMNVSMDAVRDALRARTGAQADADAATSAPPTPEANTEQADLINPMRWWDTLTQQFTHLASQTAQAQAATPPATPRKPERKATAARKTATASKPAAAKKGRKA